MPAKNEELFIAEAVDALINSNQSNWELIVVDDHSIDNTFRIVKDYADRFSNIRIERNKGQGKIEALNQGFEMSTANILKCIDADDLIDERLFQYILNEREVSCHDYYIVTSKLRKIGISRINPAFLHVSFKDCLKNLISLPRCCWSFTREIAEKIFPIPKELPFEDVWFSFMIKKYARQINYIPEPLYYYRQNEGQTYGGMLNYDKEIVKFRAKRILKVINYLENEPDKRLTDGLDVENLFDQMREFQTLLIEKDLTWGKIFSANLERNLRLKAILYRKLNWLVPTVQKAYWKLRNRR